MTLPPELIPLVGEKPMPWEAFTPCHGDRWFSACLYLTDQPAYGVKAGDWYAVCKRPEAATTHGRIGGTTTLTEQEDATP